MKHTLRPWKIRPSGTMTGRGLEVYAEGAYYDDGSELVVADCGTTECRPGGSGRWKKMSGHDELKANARLIAAAPDLLKAAQLAVLNFKRSDASGNFLGDDDHEAWGALNRAIAKAEVKP